MTGPNLTLIAPRPRPLQTGGALRWLRRNLFASVPSGIATLLLGGALLWALQAVLPWALTHAVWGGDAEACQAARGSGACWAVVTEKHRLILFGRYPFDAQWRPLIAMLVVLALVVASGARRCWRPALLWAWALGWVAAFTLLRGGVLGLAPVPTDLWGGLPLTVLLATLSMALAFPIAVALALGRQSRLPAIRALSTLYIELIRGVPLISVLFMASFMFPLLLPEGRSPDVLLRVLAGLSLFAGAYMAEIVRAGLQAVPRGQVEAAQTLGLSPWQLQRRVVLPQALAAVVPALMNNFIGLFKDTSLITIVSLYELTGALGLALNGDPVWRPFKVEAYLFITAIYFAVCFAMSRYSLSVERRLARTRAR
jgi:general L-amino acid transport system permease protein